MPSFLLQCLNPLQRLITSGCLSSRSNNYCILTLFMCGLLFVVCIACPPKLWGLGLGGFLNFSIETGPCPSLMLSQVNACWDKGGNHLGERIILNSYLLQSLSELHTSVLLLPFHCFTLRQEVNARNTSWTPPWMAAHCHWCVESPIL